MTQQFDVIIIGDSSAGKSLVKQLAKESITLSIALVSNNFKHNTTHDYINVEYVSDDVVHIDYKNKLFGCYLRSGKRLYCTHLVNASGLSYKAFTLNNKLVPNVYYNADDIHKKSKALPAVVVGDSADAVKLALDVSKKFKQVYLCVPNVQLPCSTAVKNKIINQDNIAVLYNANIIKVRCKQGVLESVELDNYSSLTCSAIFTKTEATPDIKHIPTNMFLRTANGLLATKSNCESDLVPCCFAIGNCTEKYTKTKYKNVVASILKDFA